LGVCSVCNSGCWFGDRFLQKVSMLASSWGLEDGVTRGRQRKWVRGGFLADGGFLALFCWRGMVVVGW